MKYRRAVVILALAAIGAVTTPATTRAAAQEAEAREDGGPSIQSWALAPTGSNPDEPGDRPNLSYEAQPGGTIEDSVTLWNYGNTQLTFRVYATDAFNNSSGGFDLLTGDKSPVDVGAWVTLPQPNVTVEPFTKVDLPFKLVVPPDAGPGDHAAAILASSVVPGVDSEGKVVTLDRRTGSRLYVRVAGALQPELSVEDVHTVYHAALNPLAGSVDVSYTVRNTGNVRLGGRQLVRLENLFGKKMKQAPGENIVELLPGNAVTFKAHFEHVTAALRVTAKPIVTPFPVGDAEGSAGDDVSRAGHGWAIPWSAILLIALAGAVWKGVGRYRSRSLDEPPAPPTGGAPVYVNSP